MTPSKKNRLGRVDLEVTAFGFGTAPVGNIFREIDDATSDAMYQRAWDAGVRYYDTAPMYGHGLSELRTGHSLRWKNRDDYVLSSKVGRRLIPAPKDSIEYAPWVNAGRFRIEFDYSYDGTMRSFEDSLQRMGLERMEICFIHDIDRFTRGDDQDLELLGPLPHLKLMPTGGIRLETVGEWIAAGAACLGVGTSLFRPDLVDAGDWRGLAEHTRAFMDAVQQARAARPV